MRDLITWHYSVQTDELAASAAFAALVRGAADRAFYDGFIAGVCRAHLHSPQIVAFLYAIAPPAAAENLRRNLFEEIGSAEAPGHPDLLRRLASAAGFDQARVARLERAAQEDTRRAIGAPIRLPSLRELGFSIMLEVIAFEWMLAQLAGRMGDALMRHRGLDRRALAWFYHHAEVDAGHAMEGIEALLAYADWHGLREADASVIAGLTLRENVFLPRYFDSGDAPMAQERAA